MRAEGNNRIYWLDVKFLESMSKDILSQTQLAELVPAGGENRWEQKILSAFVENGRIIQLPARRKKQFVIMQWVVEHFDHMRCAIQRLTSTNTLSVLHHGLCLAAPLSHRLQDDDP